MSSRIDAGADAARSGLRSLREALSQGLERGQDRAKDVVDASGRRAHESLDAVEKAVMGILDAVARQGRGYAKEGKTRLYATEAQIFPRRRGRHVGTALLALGAGVALSLLLRAPTKKPAPPAV
jgi:hypothetical protein